MSWAGEPASDESYQDYLKMLRQTNMRDTLQTPPQIAPAAPKPEAKTAVSKPEAKTAPVIIEVKTVPAPAETKPAMLVAQAKMESAPPRDEEAKKPKSGAYVPEAGTAGARIPISESPTARAMREKMDKLREQRVTMNFKEADLQNVIRILARYGELNVVIPPEIVKGSVTVYLDDVPLLTAFESLLKSHGLTFIMEEDGAIMRIAPVPAKEEEKPKLETVTIPLNWIKAKNLETLLKPIVTEGTVNADEISNSIIITGKRETIELVQKDIISKLDIPDKQVEIEARFVELSKDAERQLGFNWDISKPDSSGASNDVRDLLIPTRNSKGHLLPIDKTTGLRPMTAVTGIPVDSAKVSAGNPAGGSAGVWSMGTTFDFAGQDFNLAMELDAMEKRSEAETLANPRVTTLNNVEATIDLNTEIPFAKITNQPGGQSNITPEFKPVGIKMTIMPTITNNDFIRLTLDAEQKLYEGSQDIGGGNSAPVVSTRKSKANIIVKDEGTAALFGLRQLESKKISRGVPWLMRIPVLSWLFKNQDDRQLKKDLALFITPHIIKTPEMNDEQKEKYNRINLRWDLPDYFFDDVTVPSDDEHVKK